MPTAGGSSKRKAASPAAGSDLDPSEQPTKRRAPAKSRSKGKGKSGKDSAPKDVKDWPEYFQNLFKVFKALNTVLAFCSSRKHMATTFAGIRGSAESMLKRPLDLAQIAEIKTLLPDLINFAYIPENDLRVNAEAASSSSRRGRSPDFSEFASKAAAGGLHTETEEHVLILDFNGSSKGKKSNNGVTYALPPALTPAAMKKLVEKRNETFFQTVNELLLATPLSEDPATLLQSAARDHIPLDPSLKGKGKELDNMPVPESKDRPTIDAIIEEVQQASWYKEQILERRVFEQKEGRTAALHVPLSDSIKYALKTARGIQQLYTHQVAAIEALTQRQHVIVSTSTASGKSVIYQVPLLRFLEEDSASTAIFIYPTKALAQDQRGALEQLLAACPGLEHIKVATYDGDTPQEQRKEIRETASVIFTNFDMLHASVLPHEDLWRRFLKNLKLVAVDELHYYSALFGSHVAHIIRRLRRICTAIGNRRVLYVSCSATIAQPSQHMENVFGIDGVVEVTDDGAPTGRKDFLLWCPPWIDAQEPSLGRKNSMAEATCLMRFLMKKGVRVILFCKIRKTCEQAMKLLRTELSADARLDILERVMAYRGGYAQEDRRKIEQLAFSGQLLGIVATNALELGVDIGVLDAVIMLGFPVSIASFRQQSGRAGRRARDALSVLVGSEYPIDMHYMNNPDELFDKPVAELIIDVDSKIILDAHLQCAAQEMPLCMDDEQYFGSTMAAVCETSLMKDKDGWYHPNPKYLPYPSRHVSIRGVEEETYCAIDITKINQSGGTARILEEIETHRALFELYEGAIFIHQGLTFLVKEVSHDNKLAKLIRTDVNFVTEPRDYTDIDAVKTYRIREIRRSVHRAYYGRVDIRTVVFGYFKMRNKQVLDAVDLDTAPWERETTGAWVDIPKTTLDVLRRKGINAAEAIHAAQHAFLNRFAMASDLKTECKPAEKEYRAASSRRKRPARLIFYDSPGQKGSIAVKAFDHVSDILHKAFEAVRDCECDSGCAGCTESASCKAGNLVSSKAGALFVLQGILDLPMDLDAMPDINPYVDLVAAHEYGTIVEAQNVGTLENVIIERD